MRPLLMFAAALSLAPPAAAAEPTSLQGVWDGTIGNQKVRACFIQQRWGTFGAYYYLSHLRAISLKPASGKTRTFVEGYDESDSTSPQWMIESVAAKAIAGRWTHGGRSLALRLALTGSPEKEGDGLPCSSMAFNGPRLEGLRTTRKAATKDGVRYTRLILDHRGHFTDDVSIETFELSGDTPATRQINAELRKPLRPDNWFECVRSALDQNGFDGDSSETLAPRMITRRWLSVMDESGWYCGGAHPDDASVPRLFDLATGREIDLYDWLNEKAVKRERFQGDKEDTKTLQDGFRKFMLSRWKAGDPDCDEVVRSEEFWHIELTRTGFVLTPELPHVAHACGEEVRLLFGQMAPYLNAEGKRQVAALQAEVASRR